MDVTVYVREGLEISRMETLGSNGRIDRVEGTFRGPSGGVEQTIDRCDERFRDRAYGMRGGCGDHAGEWI